MAVPKRKVSKARRDKRRSSHWKLETPGIVTCPKCGAYRLPHRMCKNCLTYNGRSFGQFAGRKTAVLYSGLFSCPFRRIHHKMLDFSPSWRYTMTN